jgi:5-methylcytosine-specific restriction protein A
LLTKKEYMIKRSPSMILVGFYLAKFGVRTSKTTMPPQRLDVQNWATAFMIFYAHLGDGRTASTFCNSLKNARDMFDGHVDSGRVGWRDGSDDRKPINLTKDARTIYRKWESQTESGVWGEIEKYSDLLVGQVPSKVIDDLVSELSPSSKAIIKRTEGQRVVVSVVSERDPRLRAEALRFHGYSCAVCAFNFEKVYGEWGHGFAEVHHRVPLGKKGIAERETNVVTDLIVLCANCHRMVHRKKDRALSVMELKSKLQ